MSDLINGSEISKKIITNLKEKVSNLLKKDLRKPCLAVILVGDDQASQVYVAHKRKKCEAIGFISKFYQLEKNTTQKVLCDLIVKLNQTKEVDGVLLQLPLPQPLDSTVAIDLIDPIKDVDGLTPYNQGLLCQGRQVHTPCTPKGIVSMLDYINYNVEGQLACVVGRSMLVGTPLTLLLTKKNATVINIHTKTTEPKKLTRQADLVVVAAGVPNLVDDTWLKEGCRVIDVGIHRENNKLVGDVNFEKATRKANYISPVPGGVGPMTVASLMENTFAAYTKNLKLE